MNTRRSITLLALLAATTTAAPPVDLQGKTLAQTLDDLLPALAKSQQAAQQKWQDICFQVSAPGQEKARAEACQAMVARLDAQTPEPARLWLLAQLQRIGRDECVPAVAALLDDKNKQVRVEALRCLVSNPSPAATTKLVARLGDGKPKRALLNALGERGDKAAVAVIAKELASLEPAVAVAAAHALGRIPSREALQALQAARAKATGSLRLAVCDALLLQIDAVRTSGKLQEAQALYEGMYQPEEPRAIRLAALRALLLHEADSAGPRILRIFAGRDEDAKAIAIAFLQSPPAGVLETLAVRLKDLAPTAQAQVLSAFKLRGEAVQLRVTLEALKHENEAVRTAAVRALGRIGNEQAVNDLLALALGTTPLKAEAVESLVHLADEASSAKLAAALEAEQAAPRITALIHILERRNATQAVPALLKAATSADGSVRTAALTALRALAEPQHAAALVALLLKTPKSTDRDAAELAIVAACNKIVAADRRAEAVLTALEALPKDDRAILFPVLGRIGGPRALVVLREAVANDVAAAKTALCHWPDATASADLLKLAEAAKEPAERRLAIAALVRTNGIVTDYPAAERLATLKKALSLAPTVADRRLVLEGIGFVRHLDSLRYAVPYLDDKEMVPSACKAVIELAHSRMLREPNKEEFHKALDRAIALCKDKALVERAKGYRAAP